MKYIHKELILMIEGRDQSIKSSRHNHKLES